MKKNWRKTGDNTYQFDISEKISFRLEYKPKEISAGTFVNKWLMSGSLDNTTWHEHIIDHIHLETAQKKVEDIVLAKLMERMKYHLDIGNEYANMLSKVIVGGDK
jgi:hypothetical protein